MQIKKKKKWKHTANTSKYRLQALLFWLQKGEFARHEPQMAKALCGPPDGKLFFIWKQNSSPDKQEAF